LKIGPGPFFKTLPPLFREDPHSDYTTESPDLSGVRRGYIMYIWSGIYPEIFSGMFFGGPSGPPKKHSRKYFRIDTRTSDF
jgi:hypothetical protein